MARGRVTFHSRRGWAQCDASVYSAQGVLIWSDNSGPGAFPGLLQAAHRVAAAATEMENRGQILESWRDIVDRAPRL